MRCSECGELLLDGQDYWTRLLPYEEDLVVRHDNCFVARLVKLELLAPQVLAQAQAPARAHSLLD